MSNLKQSFASSSPIIETRDFVTHTDPATGTVTDEVWRKENRWGSRKLDRADGPAVIQRDAPTGSVTLAEWWKDGKRFEPSPEVRAAWLNKEAQQNAERIARLAASSAPVPPAPSPK